MKGFMEGAMSLALLGITSQCKSTADKSALMPTTLPTSTVAVMVPPQELMVMLT